MKELCKCYVIAVLLVCCLGVSIGILMLIQRAFGVPVSVAVFSTVVLTGIAYFVRLAMGVDRG